MSADVLYRIIGQLYVELLGMEARVKVVEELLSRKEAKPRAV